MRWGGESVTRDEKVWDKEEVAEAYVGHFFVYPEPGDPTVTHILHVPKGPLELAQEQGHSSSSTAWGHSRAM